MATTPGALGRRYLPFIALAAVQVLLVAVAPSKVASRVETAGGRALSPGGAATVDANGNPVGADTGAVDASGNPVGAANGSVDASGNPVAAGPDATIPAGADMSHCAKSGKEIGPTYYMPKCKPVWHGGDNGGATMTGASATEVKFVFYRAKSDPQVDFLLSSQDLAASLQDSCQSAEAFYKYVNKRYEMYGRHLVSMEGGGANQGSTKSGNCKFPYFTGNCTLTPPDPPCERREARVIAAMKPAFVFASTADPAFFDELSKLHIVTMGGGATTAPPPQEYFTNAAPYYWDVFTSGTVAMDLLSEYVCKKLIGKPVKYAGVEVLHPSGSLTAPPRKFAINFPETNGDPTGKISADRFVKAISGGKCGKPGTVIEYPYQSDIGTAAQQSTNTVAQMKKDGITTAICYCDPIAPIFLSRALAAANYHPEILTSGTGLLDYDKLARLYEPTVWQNAFGPSLLQIQLPFDKSDAVLAWQDAGYAGQPDKTENLNFAYWNLMGNMIQNAGPRLTPENIQQGMFTAGPAGGWALTHDPHYPLIQYQAPDDYTGISDEREVWWCKSAVSTIDNEPGSYISVNGGQRYTAGQWLTADPKVFDQPCA
ncbi:MAG: hypothetical protein JWO37_738 [Acidimicrobiales bacterium]|jgi:hypothetical protein|nr:hypothetical protein [Acidimicrobiales bacterium]